LNALGENIAASSKEILDVWHNFVEKRNVSAGLWDGGDGTRDIWIHRKGAASTFDGAVVIPGSRGARSYIVFLLDGEQASSVIAVKKHGYI
jgi:release factor H-coupled RctB family protein